MNEEELLRRRSGNLSCYRRNMKSRIEYDGEGHVNLYNSYENNRTGFETRDARSPDEPAEGEKDKKESIKWQN